MFSHDPFQSYSAYTPYIGANPYGNPYATLQQQAPLMNPLAGIAGYGGIHPHHLHSLAAQAQIQQQLQNPFQQFQNPMQQLQNPLTASLIQNPLLLAALQNPILASQMQNPFLTSQVQNPFATGQPQNPYLAGQLQNPLIGLQNPLLTQQAFGYGWQQNPYSPYGMQSPYGQYSPQLQPQSWVGQGIGGQHPLFSQLGGRQAQTPGTPWGVS